MSGAPTEAEVLAGMHKAVGSLEEDKKTGGAGKKSKATEKPAVDVQPDVKRLRSIVDRIVRLEEEKRGLSDDIKEIYTEAKSAGWSKKALRLYIKEELEDADAREARESAEFERDRMKSLLGDLASTPLGEFAVNH